jgi:DNA polymerase beta
MKGAIGKDRQKHQFRLAQFKKAIGTLTEYQGEITSGRQAKTLPGIGTGIATRIDEIIKTGTLEELVQTTPIDPQAVLIHELTSVTGIGEMNAKKFIEQGVTSLQDLRDRGGFAPPQPPHLKEGGLKGSEAPIGTAFPPIKLTHHMQMGLKYYNDFQQRIPFQEVEEIGQLIRQAAQTAHPEVMVEIAGSHRRMKPFSGDLDVLMTSSQVMTEDDLIASRIHYLKDIVKVLKEHGVIVDDLTSQGDTKYMGVCVGRHSPPMTPPSGRGVKGDEVPPVGHRIDIRFVPMESYYPAILYFTGSQQFNIRMRQVALERGYTLNEYGIYDLAHQDRKIVVHSEKEIFNLLGLLYLEPIERDFI